MLHRGGIWSIFRNHLFEIRGVMVLFVLQQFREPNA